MAHLKDKKEILIHNFRQISRQFKLIKNLTEA